MIDLITTEKVTYTTPPDAAALGALRRLEALWAVEEPTDEQMAEIDQLEEQLPTVREVRLLLRDLIADHVDTWHVDAMGNLIATKKGTGEQDMRVMVDAHMDEVGLMVTEICSDGMLRFATVGGFQSQALLGKVVQVGAKKITGVIGAKPIHLLNSGEYNRAAKIDSMRIDIGARN